MYFLKMSEILRCVININAFPDRVLFALRDLFLLYKVRQYSNANIRILIPFKRISNATSNYSKRDFVYDFFYVLRIIDNNIQIYKTHAILHM